MARVRHPRRAARARALRRGPARRRLDDRRRAVVARAGGGPLLRATARRRAAASSSWRAGSSATARTPARTAGSRSARSSRSSGRPGAAASGREDLIEKQFEQPGLGRARRGRARLPRAHARRVGAVRLASTTAASSRCSTSTRRSTPSSCARARWWSSSTSRAPATVRQLGVAGQAVAHARRARRGRARRSASTPTRCWAGSATPTRRSRALEQAGAVAGPADGRAGLVHVVSDERPAEDARARRGERRLGGHDQALPARGPAARAGQDLAQHGLLPARVRRAHPADQAAPGGALHAAQADQGGARRGPGARPGAGRARGPDPGARRAARQQPRLGAPSCKRRYDVPQEVLDRLAELEVLTPNTPRLRAARRPDRRGDQPLPRRRLRRAHRLHRLRHAALQARARGAREGGGRRC